MKKRIKRINLEERIEISQLLAKGKNNREIAEITGRHPSTISRELRRCKKGQYNVIIASQDMVDKDRQRRYNKTKIFTNPKLKYFVYSCLLDRWSPDQISTTLKTFYPMEKDMQISHESLYSHIYMHSGPELRGVLISDLRQKRKVRGNTRRGVDKRTTIKDPTRIDERPQEVLSRDIPGHWEGDLVLGRDSAVGTLAERTSRFYILVPLKRKDSASVKKAFVKAFKKIPRHLCKTMTYDNGTEMAQHKEFTKDTKIKVYFTHPYSPWERPTNENFNGLLRDYFPKGTDFNKVSAKRLKEVQDALNNRPRKVLGYDTPRNVFERIILKINEKPEDNQ